MRTRPTHSQIISISVFILLALAVFRPLTAHAGDEPDDWKNFAKRTGTYISVSGAGTIASDDLSIPGSSFGALILPQTSLSLNSGYAGIAAFGIYQGSARGEVEFSYRRNDIGKVTSTSALTSGTGDMAAYSIMFNGYGDLPLTRRISIYLGGGLGVTVLDLNAHVNQAGAASYAIDSSSAAFALQGMVGVNLQITSRLHLTGGYRAWTAVGVNASFVSTGGGTIVHASSNDSFDLPIMHGPEIGLRFDF